MRYRGLEKGEIIQKGDEKDACVNPWKDKPKWVNAASDIGEQAPDPKYPAHTRYRRPVYPFGYEVTIEAMRRSVDPSTRCLKLDASALVADIRNCFAMEIDVPHGQALAVIDYLLEIIQNLQDANYGLTSAITSSKSNGIEVTE